MHYKDSHSHHQHHGNSLLSSASSPPTKLFYHTQLRRQLGDALTTSCRRQCERFLARQLPALLTEKEYNLGEINKIFAAQWVSRRAVAFGTKCNKLFVLDLPSGQIDPIPMLKSSDRSQPAECPCGIHSIAINPSKSLLATGALNTNDLAVYSLPTFDPVAIGEAGHSDWVFDIKWLDDQFLVTGSRDSKLALWRVNEDEHPQKSSSGASSLSLPDYSTISPIAVKRCKKAEKVRALAYNEPRREVAALSLNAHIYTWDMSTFQQTVVRKLAYSRENVCLASSPEHHLYAVGSQSYVSFLDSRTMKNAHHIISKQRGCGIRSVSFNEDIVTFGTGAGAVYFFDLRANNYLEMNCGHTCELNVGKGFLLHDDTYQYFFMDHEHPNAVYTHCYDPTGTRLFTAGGPLPAGLWGNYAAVWQ